MPKRWVPNSAGRCFTRPSPEGVELETGSLIPADTVVISIGDAPDLEFLPGDVATERGFIGQRPLPDLQSQGVIAIGDVVRPGLLTDAIGAGPTGRRNHRRDHRRQTARCDDRKMVIDINRIAGIFGPADCSV
jgi:hypothetical protein